MQSYKKNNGLSKNLKAENLGQNLALNVTFIQFLPEIIKGKYFSKLKRKKKIIDPVVNSNVTINL